MKTRPGHFQIRLPEFLATMPNDFAIELNWYSRGNRPGRTDGHYPHMSLVISSLLAGVKQEAPSTRARIFRNGLSFIRNEETRRNVTGSSRMRAFRINTIGQLEKLP